MIPQLRPDEIERFYSKLELGGCGMRWTGPVNNHGYGRFEYYRNGKRKRILAHRLAHYLATGEDPGKLKIRHQCDTPPCCTPDCLITGTQADNMHDARDRGRMNVRGLREWSDSRPVRAQERIAAGRKQCSHCRQVKEFDEFGLYRYSLDGHRGQCKKCRKGVAA